MPSPDVFISYSQSDAGQYAKAIQNILQSRGFSVFVDNCLLGAEDIAETIRDAIDKSSVVLVLLSKSAATSSWITAEVALAIRRNRHVVPVVLDEAALESALSSLLGDRIGLALTGKSPKEVAVTVGAEVTKLLGTQYRHWSIRRIIALNVAIEVLLAILAVAALLYSTQSATFSRDASVVSLRQAADLRGKGGAPQANLRGILLVDVDLSQLNFRQATLARGVFVKSDFSGAILDHADLGQSVLAAARFRRAKARDATFRDANLAGCDLTDADCVGANFSGADLRAADMSRCDLRDAVLESADLRGATIDGARLENATYDENTKFPREDFDPSSLGMRQSPIHQE